MSGIRIRHLLFTGPNVEAEGLRFDDGLNIVYGASNTGKSFAALALLYMLGASSKLPPIDEIAYYDGMWLGLTLPNGEAITLYRSTKGGGFRRFEGLRQGGSLTGGTVLRNKHDAKRTDTLSHLLLQSMGLAGKQIVRDSAGTKENLSISTLSPYAVVSEEDIMSTRSPVFLSGIPAERTLEKNLFKLLLTGSDDANVVSEPKEGERKVAKAAKVELIDELIAQVDREFGGTAPDRVELDDQLARLETNADGLLGALQQAQSLVDSQVTARRQVCDRQQDLRARAGELELTRSRFDKLQAVYASDLARLQSIEEGGYVLAAMVGMDCAVCGASPEDQRHNHAADEISMAHVAAAAEARKIEREQGELAQVIDSLSVEANALNRTLGDLDTEIEAIDLELRFRRATEASFRESYETYSDVRSELTKAFNLHARRAQLAARRSEIAADSVKRVSEALTVGPDTSTSFDFGKTVKAVLEAWHFPDAEKVLFDTKLNDITIGGKPRQANGKGVRAVLHAAFNVAVILHCIKNRRPHPGFLVLDTPLLTYREPLKSRHGELAPDEAALKGTNLAEHFYRHLASLRAEVQIIVIENADPPSGMKEGLARIETFTANSNDGRYGLLEKRPR